MRGGGTKYCLIRYDSVLFNDEESQILFIFNKDTNKCLLSSSNTVFANASRLYCISKIEAAHDQMVNAFGKKTNSQSKSITGSTDYITIIGTGQDVEENWKTKDPEGSLSFDASEQTLMLLLFDTNQFSAVKKALNQ